jgi:hypothetical protein
VSASVGGSFKEKICPVFCEFFCGNGQVFGGGCRQQTRNIPGAKHSESEDEDEQCGKFKRRSVRQAISTAPAHWPSISLWKWSLADLWYETCSSYICTWISYRDDIKEPCQSMNLMRSTSPKVADAGRKQRKTNPRRRGCPRKPSISKVLKASSIPSGPN